MAPWRHKCSHVPVLRRLFDRLPVRISTSDLHHQILRKKLISELMILECSFPLTTSQWSAGDSGGPCKVVFDPLDESMPWLATCG